MQNGQSYKQLKTGQLESFDTEYVNSDRWIWFRNGMEDYFGNHEKIDILDLGGGTGKFIDRVLENYPKAVVTIVDNSRLLLDKNQPDQKKKLILGSVFDIDELLNNACFDIICCNWLLHHLVGNSYSLSRLNIESILLCLKKYLKPEGKISIYENLYDGLFFNGLPGRIIYSLTASKRLAHFTKKMGANTVGTGVCFLSQKQWEETFRKAGLNILSFDDEKPWKFGLIHKSILHLGKVRIGHFWLHPTFLVHCG